MPKFEVIYRCGVPDACKWLKANGGPFTREEATEIQYEVWAQRYKVLVWPESRLQRIGFPIGWDYSTYMEQKNTHYVDKDGWWRLLPVEKVAPAESSIFPIPHLYAMAIPINNDDWGSQRQVDAEDALYRRLEDEGVIFDWGGEFGRDMAHMTAADILSTVMQEWEKFVPNFTGIKTERQTYIREQQEDKMPEWTKEDNNAAQKEGWAIFHNSDAAMCEVQRLDEANDWGEGIPQLAGDAEAWKLIRKGMAEGNKLHAKVLTYLKEKNPAEYELVTGKKNVSRSRIYFA